MPAKSPAIKLSVDPEELEGLVKAVDFLNAYLASQQRSNGLYTRLAERLRFMDGQT